MFLWSLRMLLRKNEEDKNANDERFDVFSSIDKKQSASDAQGIRPMIVKRGARVEARVGAEKVP